jgi:hypothetical protein
LAIKFPDQVNPPLGYGHDLSCLSDLTSDMAEVDGRILLGQALARRLQTPRGGLIDDPDYGYDITGEIGDDMDARKIAKIATRIDAECLKDPRVFSSDTVTTFASGFLTIVITITDRDGPFKLVLVANDITLTLMQIAA